MGKYENVFLTEHNAEKDIWSNLEMESSHG